MSHVQEAGVALLSGSLSENLSSRPVDVFGDGVAFPTSGWKSLFNESHLLAYFVNPATRCGDGQARDFKAIASTDQKSRRLFESGYVQKIELSKSGNRVFYQARCMPEMRTRPDYKLRMYVGVAKERERSCGSYFR